MMPDPLKQDQHVPSIDKCELDMLAGHKGPQHEVKNVTSVSQSSKPYFVFHIQQSTPAKTTFSVTRSVYCMRPVSHWNSNLLTTPSS